MELFHVRKPQFSRKDLLLLYYSEAVPAEGTQRAVSRNSSGSPLSRPPREQPATVRKPAERADGRDPHRRGPFKLGRPIALLPFSLHRNSQAEKVTGAGRKRAQRRVGPTRTGRSVVPPHAAGSGHVPEPSARAAATTSPLLDCSAGAASSGGSVGLPRYRIFAALGTSGCERLGNWVCFLLIGLTLVINAAMVLDLGG